MSDEQKTDPGILGPLPGEDIKDYASRRLVELKNSEFKFVNNINQAQANLEQAKADLIACRARIDEMAHILQPKPEETSDEGSEKS